MSIKKITPEALRIALVCKPKTKYEISQILTASYNRTLEAIKEYGIATDLPDGFPEHWEELKIKYAGRLDLILNGSTLEEIGIKTNRSHPAISQFIDRHGLYEQWQLSRNERGRNLITSSQ